MFEIEYLTDKNGQPKAVVIPIEVWKRVFTAESISEDELSEDILPDIIQKLSNIVIHMLDYDMNNRPESIETVMEVFVSIRNDFINFDDSDSDYDDISSFFDLDNKPSVSQPALADVNFDNINRDYGLFSDDDDSTNFWS